VEARHTASPTTNFDAGGCSPDDRVTQPCTEPTQTIVVSHGLIWGLFHFAGKDNDTSCAGMILGFVRFKTPGFPTPDLVDKWGNSVPAEAIDHGVYGVARCSPDFENFDNKFVTKVTLILDEHGVYIFPLKRLISPLACVPNILNEFQDHLAN
jgi:hypothetical protein